MKKVFEFFALLLDEDTDKKDKCFREFVCQKPNKGFYLMHESLFCHNGGNWEVIKIENNQIYKSDLELCDNLKISPEILISLN